MQSIVSKGKDVNEAIKVGLGLLETTKKEVSIEIIQHESKGFLGIGGKKAVVKLTKLTEAPPKEAEINKERPTQDIPTEETATEKTRTQNLKDNGVKDSEIIEEDSLAGKVWIKNGEIHFKPSQTQFPTVTVKNGIKLYKNDQLVTEKTTVISENNTYRIEAVNEEKQTTWQVSIEDYKLNVKLYVEPGYILTRSIPDIEADHHIELFVNESKEIYNSLSVTEVMEKLESLQVSKGINQEEIKKALETNQAGTFIIANGKSAQPGKNGWAEFKIATGAHEGLKEKNGKIDFREFRTFPTIERGRVIAVVHPPIPGEEGYTVTGEPIPAKESMPIVLKTGKGVVVIDDKIVSTESGRPHIEQRGLLLKVSIMPKLDHPGNVNLTSGNIRFVGDVEIYGEVEEQMTVEAEGDIVVHKSVNFSTLTASGAITSFGNIVGSEISAGKNNMLVAELGHLLGIIYQDIEKIISLIKQLTLNPAFKSSDFSRGGLQPLIRILLEKKFKSFPALAKKYVEVVRRGERYLDDDIWRETANSISQLFLSLTNEVTSFERLEQLSKKIKELHELSKTPVEPDSYITIPNAQNSTLYCSGNILVLGQGCVNTKIHAGGTLKVNGILRGGEVYGRLGVEINEVGSDSGTPTVISVPSDQSIRVNKAMEGTCLKVGNITHTLKETKYSINARLDKNEKLVLQ